MHPCVGSYKYLQVLGGGRAGSPEFNASPPKAGGLPQNCGLTPHQPLGPGPPMQTFLPLSANRGEYFLVLEGTAFVC